MIGVSQCSSRRHKYLILICNGLHLLTQYSLVTWGRTLLSCCSVGIQIQKPCVWEKKVCPSESTVVQKLDCLCLTPVVCTTRTRMCARVKVPISICRRPQDKPVVWSDENTAHWGKKKKLGNPVLRLLAFPPGKSSLNSRRIALGQESYII